MLVTNDPATIEYERLRHAIHTKIKTDTTVQVIGNSAVEIAEPAQPSARIVTLILVIETINRRDSSLGERCNMRVLLAARNAPTGKHIQNTDLALELRTVER